LSQVGYVGNSVIQLKLEAAGSDQVVGGERWQLGVAHSLMYDGVIWKAGGMLYVIRLF